MAAFLYVMRQPCPTCDSQEGVLVTKNGQDTVTCARCGRHCYNAPRSETGRLQRKVTTRGVIKPSRKYRILERDHHTCVSCHSGDKPLHVGHLISVEDGRRHGIPDDLIESDLNLAAFCDECNLGLGASTVSIQLMWRCMEVHLAQQRSEGAA